MKIFRSINLAAIKTALAATLLMVASTAYAGILNDLPTIRVNGKIMYYYDTQSGDNVYSIAEKLGVTVNDIRQYNPSASDGIKPRMRLFFPTDLVTEETGNSAGPLTHVVSKGESIYGIARRYGMTTDELVALNPVLASNPVKPGMRLTLNQYAASAAPAAVGSADSSATTHSPVRATDAPAALPADAETPAATLPEADTAEITPDAVQYGDSVASAAPAGELHIAVMLPFLLNEPTMGRQTKLYTEFYKGFLLAAESCNTPGATPVRIHAYDTAANTDSVSEIMQRPEMEMMDLIVAPDNIRHLDIITSRAPESAWILNVFAVKDSSYLTNPAMIQTNIPHDEMYSRAIDGFLDRFRYFTPVFLSRADGKTDKVEFTDALKEALSMKGIIYKTVNFDGYLSDADLEAFDPSANSYVFIPLSGNRDEFQRFLHALKALKEKATDPSAVQLFGYPEWATFRGSQLDEICQLQTTIYSRYFPTEKDTDAARVNQAFESEFGDGVIDKQMPVLGILGYDTGRMVIDGLRTQASSGLFPSDFSGIQSGIRLLRSGQDGGLFNNALFIITYNPDGHLEKILQ